MPKTMTERPKNAIQDIPDSRDWLYQPALIRLPPTMKVPEDLQILDQEAEGACTGFALAAAINLLNQRRDVPERVSARMLYEMAKRHDEWPGEEYEGSSLRGAIQGWRNMGVCSENKWKYVEGRAGYLTVNRAKDARKTTIGAYYRLRPRISDFHAAINETGVIAVSAQVHKGWDDPSAGKIKFHKQNDGGHAFIIVGYNENGFFVQNSWGSGWGKNGVALWFYEDWIKNVMDAWVFRLALPTPQLFGLEAESSTLYEDADVTEKKKPTVERARIAGHFVHIDDGQFHTTGRYWSDSQDVGETAKLVAASQDYEHLLVYAHGGLNSPKASARRVAAMKEGFKRNRIYPFHIMYDTGLGEELQDLVLRRGKDSQQRVGGGIGKVRDRFLERLLRVPGTAVWEEMKQDARDAFANRGAGKISLELFIRHMRAPSARAKKIHLVGHSTGAIVIAHLLEAMRRMDVTIENCFLLAPACRVELFHSNYLPALEATSGMRIRNLLVFNLREKLEQDDNVMKVYGKSLLYLVSNAFERERGRPLLGMEKFVSEVKKVRGLPAFHYSDGATGNVTRSTSHGGFDNDPFTMNHILKTILDGRIPDPFRAEELAY